MGERSRNGTIAVRAVKWVVTIYSVYTMLYIRYTEIVWWMLRTTSEKKRQHRVRRTPNDIELVKIRPFKLAPNMPQPQYEILYCGLLIADDML